MESTPIKRLRKSSKATKLRTKVASTNEFESKSPTRSPLLEESPIYLRCTQELSDDVDVVWNYSPQNSNRHNKPNKRKKRLLLNSPKVPIKRYPSNSQIQNFEKFREEMQALREQIALVDESDCLSLSPDEEASFKDLSTLMNVEEEQVEDFDFFPSTPHLSTQQTTIGVVNDFFDDDMDEQLVMFSQIVEENLPKPNGNSNIINTNDNLTNVPSNVQYSGKVQFCRTGSFESTAKSEIILSKSELEKIEERRKEALAKLASKKSQEGPSKCTQEEIEKKRLEAIAKLKAKQQKDAIEYKRREALKRLELNKNKHHNIIQKS